MNVRRQSAASAFNMTQAFAVSGGQPFTISFEAEEAGNGGSSSSCSVQICVDSDCGPEQSLTTSYDAYSYTSTPLNNETSVTASINFACDGPAFVGLDAVSASSGSSPNALTVYSTIEETILAPGSTVFATVTGESS